MPTIFFRGILIVFFIFITQLVFAQQTEQDTALIYRVETKDGNIYEGVLIKRTMSELTIKTSLGVLTIPQENIVRVYQSDARFKGRKPIRGLGEENPQSTRYFISPTGYNLRKGEGYVQNSWVLFNQVNYGLGDNISIGGGMMPLFLFGADVFPVWITPKISVPIAPDRFNLGLGAFIGGAAGTDGGAFGMVYGVTTYGTRDRNASFGIGYGFAEGEIAQIPLLTFSMMYRLHPKWYFMSESFFLVADDEAVGIISAGGRSVFGSISLDYGFFVPTINDVDNFVAIPWVSVMIPFGRGRNR